MMRILLAALVAVTAMPAVGQTPIPNDPFQSVPAPVVRPRPVERPPEARPRPAPRPRPAATVFPVGVGQSFRDCGDCPEMVVIPAGRFVMGSPASEAGRNSEEGPQREVVVGSSLAVGKFEVTFGEWDACAAGGGCSHLRDDAGWGRGTRPVMRVSWNDAQEYVRWISQRTGRRYRLLTKAEWEYAARGGTTTAYSFGATISPSQAVFNASRTEPVGSRPANRFGLYDMHGNVWEWVEDCYVSSYAGAPTDASQPVTTGGCSARVLRGGSWSNTPQFLRAAHRGAGTAGDRNIGFGFGFRLARTPGG